MDYIARICENALAARVKYADLQDNLDISRIPNPTEKDFARIRKYEQAMKRITYLCFTNDNFIWSYRNKHAVPHRFQRMKLKIQSMRQAKHIREK